MKMWTADEVRALGVRVDGVVACEIAYGAGKTKAYELLSSGAVDFPVVRVGRRYIAPTAGLLRFLGLAAIDRDAVERAA